MKYTLSETIETVGWSEAVGNAPADLVKIAKEMAERGEPATFAKIQHNTTPATFTWCIVSINSEGHIYCAHRSTNSTS